MHVCEACHKVYTTKYNLKSHWERQPVCEKWVKMQSGLKEYIDHKFSVEEDKKTEQNTTCLACNTTFANVGNLNRHLSTNLACSKWDLYNDLQPVQTYIGKLYSEFETPKYALTHIIWNVFLIDKEFIKKPKIREMLQENSAKYIIAILPADDKTDTKSQLDALEITYDVMSYEEHNMNIDQVQFDKQCDTIEEYRKRRENVFVFCNTGYQRSIPFLTYYLFKHHPDEIPTIDRAIDIILSQVDKSNYGTLREKYINSMKTLFEQFE
jgi:hypothetical protein